MVESCVGQSDWGLAVIVVVHGGGGAAAAGATPPRNGAMPTKRPRTTTVAPIRPRVGIGPTGKRCLCMDFSLSWKIVWKRSRSLGPSSSVFGLLLTRRPTAMVGAAIPERYAMHITSDRLGGRGPRSARVGNRHGGMHRR